MSSSDAPDAVSHGELVSNVRYGYWFNHLCERFYARSDFALNLVQLVGGGAAALSVLQKSPTMMTLSGVGLAVTAALSLLIQPAVKAERHRRAKCDYLALEAVSSELTFAELQTKLMKTRMDAPTGIEALAAPAYNATLRAIGSSARPMEESIFSRVAKALA